SAGTPSWKLAKTCPAKTTQYEHWLQRATSRDATPNAELKLPSLQNLLLSQQRKTLLTYRSRRLSLQNFTPAFWVSQTWCQVEPNRNWKNKEREIGRQAAPGKKKWHYGQDHRRLWSFVADTPIPPQNRQHAQPLK